MSSTRGRRSRALLIPAVVVAVAAMLAVVWVVFGRTTDTPEESAAAPATETSSPPSAEPSPSPTPDGAPPIVALTEGGALVELDPVSGEVLRTVATNEHWIDLTLTADGTTAYVTARDLDKPVTGLGWSDEVQRVSLVDGASEPIATGWSPAVSPDGRALAYVGVIDVANDVQEDPPYSRALIVLDLITGETTVVIDNECVECGRVVGPPRWAPDGSTVYLQAGWGDALMGTSTAVVVVTPGTTASIQDSPVIGPTSGDGYSRSWAAPDVFNDGRLIVSVTEASDAAVSAYDQNGDRSGFVEYVAIIDPDAGEEERRIDVPGVDGFAVAPDGHSVAMLDNRWLEEGVERYTLSVWSDDGLRPLGEGYVAVAW